MLGSPFRILCTGDVHLGRRPSRVPIEEEQLSVEYVWESFVEAAINQAVDAVVLTGDIVDTENKMYEALEPLERGLQRLLDEAISTSAYLVREETRQLSRFPSPGMFVHRLALVSGFRIGSKYAFFHTT